MRTQVMLILLSPGVLVNNRSLDVLTIGFILMLMPPFISSGVALNAFSLRKCAINAPDFQVF